MRIFDGIPVPLVLFVLFLGACSESSTGPDSTNQNTGPTPGAGSTYTYFRFDADSSGAPLPGTMDTAVVTLASTNGSFLGVSPVHVFISGNDTMPLLNYRADGDLSWYPSYAQALGSGWITLPVVTKTSAHRTLRDTSIDLGGGNVGRSTVTLAVDHLGESTFQLLDRQIPVQRVRVQVVTTSPLTAEQNLIETESVTLWYAKDLGYFVREERARTSESPFGLIAYPTRTMYLVSFNRR